jgi:hypothetical protein
MGGGRGAGKARHAPVRVRLCGQNRITVVLRGPTASGFCVLWHWSLWMTHTQAFSSVSLAMGIAQTFFTEFPQPFFHCFIPIEGSDTLANPSVRQAAAHSRPCTACSLRPVDDAALPLLPQPPQRCHGVPGTQGSAGNSEMLARTREAHDNGTVFFGILDTSKCTLR